MVRSAIQRARGVAAQPSSFVGLNREITINTDTKVAHVHDGVTPGGFPLDYTCNVKRFGAKGNGVTDDTLAIKAAVAAVATTGGVVSFPAGTYVVTDEILITDNGVTLRGEAGTSSATAAGTWIKTASTTKDIVRVSDRVRPLDGFTMENINLYGLRTGVTGSGLRVEASNARAISNIRLRNVTATGCKDYGIILKADGAGNFVFKVDMENVKGSYCGNNGIRLEGAVTQVNAQGLWSDYNGDHQVALVGKTTASSALMNVTLMRLTAANAPAGKFGLYLTRCDSISVQDLYTEDNAGGEVLIHGLRFSRLKGGRLQQANASQGIVLGDDGGAYRENTEIEIDIPGWTNTSSNTLFTLSHSTGNSQEIHFGRSSAGPITLADVSGAAEYFLLPLWYYWPQQQIAKSLNVLPYYVAKNGTWTQNFDYIHQQLIRTPANDTMHTIYMDVPLSSLVTPGQKKGIHLTGEVVVVYEVTGADPGDDVNVGIYRWSPPADNVADSASKPIDGLSWDAAHDTAAKRSNSGGTGHQHNVLTYNFTPTWLDFSSDQVITVILQVIESDNAANAFYLTVKGVFLRYAEAPI